MQVSKPHKSKILKQLGFVVVCVAFGWYLKAKTTPSMMAGMMGQGTPYVLVKAAEVKDTTQAKNHIAHVEAINSVNLLPQVSGTVDEVLFEEGSFVNVGDVLFVIDQDRYKSTLDLREAELAQAKANLTQAQRNYNRQIKLSKQNIASKATFDTAESAYLQAQAAVKQAEANVKLAKIDFEYTQVKAPISGYIGKALITKGNYVTASAQTLARIVQLNPIRITFSLTDKEFLQLKNKYQVNPHLQARIVLPDGTTVIEDFASRFVDNEVNTNTATVSIYGDFDNKEEKILPGNYVQIALIGKAQSSVMIDQGSLMQDEHGFYTFVVGDDDTVEERRLVLGDVIGSEQVVKEGLKAGEKVIVQGIQKVQNGIKVKAALIQPNS